MFCVIFVPPDLCIAYNLIISSYTIGWSYEDIKQYYFPLLLCLRYYQISADILTMELCQYWQFCPCSHYIVSPCLVLALINKREEWQYWLLISYSRFLYLELNTVVHLYNTDLQAGICFGRENFGGHEGGAMGRYERVFSESFKIVSRKIEGCFNGVLSGFQGGLRMIVVEDEFQRWFEDVSRKF